MKETYNQKIMELLKNAKEPMDVAKIRVACNIGNWNTALKHCLELLVDGRINGQRTSKGWIFWPKREARTID
jgi:hypothetical protein